MSKEKSAFLHQNNSHTNNNLEGKKAPLNNKKSYKLVLLEARNLNLLHTDESLQLLKAEFLDKEHNSAMNQIDSAHTELSAPT